MTNIVYHQNFRAQSLRNHGSPNAWKFSAATDVAAEALATAIAAFAAGQEVSLTSQLSAPEEGTPPPVGSRISSSTLLIDANGAVYRVQVRNVQPTALSGDLALLFTGAPGGTFGLTALGAPPALPSTLAPVVSTVVTLRTLLS